ncbi:MAG: SIS domain-containing protein [Oscillospiraceae bacterium]|nr:SIS domain-containing protein [Oscillospiraceae bacterium]
MDYAEAYFEQVENVLGRIEDHADDYEAAAAQLLARLKKGGMIYTFGTGHGHLLALEVFYRAGGLVRVCPILNDELMLHVSASASSQYERREGVAESLLNEYGVGENDALIVISNSGINPLPIEMALGAKQRGALTIALTNLAHSKPLASRHHSGKKLYELCDIVLDNCGVLGDACVPAKSGSICPTSTIAGAMILHTIVADLVELAEKEGFPLETYASSNVPGGDARNAQYIEKYKKVIKCL